ncbi:unknown [Clostridium sp. CAG:768]|nr:unknown [Clostridium sp. CAG:768]
MKRFEVDQTQKSCKNNQSCVEVSTCVAVGGGAI